MAFTAAQKKDIRKYMGVSFGFYDLNHRLESMMDLVGTNVTDQTEIEGWLTRITAIDAALTGSSSSTATYGALKKVDEVEFYDASSAAGDDNSIGLVKQGRVLIGRIARALGVSDYLPVGDYFGSGGANGYSISLG